MKSKKKKRLPAMPPAFCVTSDGDAVAVIKRTTIRGADHLVAFCTKIQQIGWEQYHPRLGEIPEGHFAVRGPTPEAVQGEERYIVEWREYTE